VNARSLVRAVEWAAAESVVQRKLQCHGLTADAEVIVAGRMNPSRVLFAALIASFAVGSLACSSSSTTATTTPTPGACPLAGDPKVASITKTSGDAACPALTADQLNTPDDSGTAGCTPKLDTKACTATIQCSEKDADGSTTTSSGSFVNQAGTISGSMSVTVTKPDGSAGGTCAYALTLR
jgi:hypothetical protein